MSLRRIKNLSKDVFLTFKSFRIPLLCASQKYSLGWYAVKLLLNKNDDNNNNVLNHQYHPF